jgi:hypothetical protein
LFDFLSMNRLSQFQLFHEKLASGFATLAASGLAYVGAILTEGEVRWVCITLASSILMAMFCAVIVRAPSETMKVTVCRAGFSIMVGCLGTRELLLRWGLDAFEHDAIRLAGIASGMTVAGMVLGYPLLLLANTKGKDWAKMIIERLGPKA